MLNVTTGGVGGLLERGRRLHAAGQLTQAEQVYRRVLSVQPEHPVALALLGTLALQAGHLPEAAVLLRRAIVADECYAEAYTHLGIVLAAQGQFREAAGSYRRALALKPDYAGAYYHFGLLLSKTNQLDGTASETAVEHYRRTIRFEPRFAEAHYNLGVAMAEAGKWEEAIGCYRAALEFRPGFPEAIANLTTALCAANRMEEAVQECRKCLTLNGNRADVHYQLGLAFLRQQQFAAAAGAFKAAIGIKEDFADTHHGLAIALSETGQAKEAVAACRRAVKLSPRKLEPHCILASLLLKSEGREAAIAALRQALTIHVDSPDLRFLLSAVAEDQAIKNAPASYIESVFEAYASRFDDHLVGRLQYRGPEYLGNAVRTVAPGRIFDEVMDLGCGTGLCGVEFRPMAKRLAGVDLAPTMAARARARGIYDVVRKGELVAALRDGLGRYDLVVAGDVLEYVGALDEVFAAAHGALHAEGLFAFTVEKSEGEGLVLLPTFRYAHSLSYLRELAGRSGFEETFAEEKPLRMESGKPITAWIVVLRKTSLKEPFNK